MQKRQEYYVCLCVCVRARTRITTMYGWIEIENTIKRVIALQDLINTFQLLSVCRLRCCFVDATRTILPAKTEKERTAKTTTTTEANVFCVYEPEQ